ncbi:hypothetical protein GC173_14480 [bacterium]|nr:hypothetical protein [bacterium]
MKRASHLIYTDKRTSLQSSQSTDGDVFYRSEEGVPVLWFFAFGARNVYTPGDTVEDRGGEVGNRNPYETQIETAIVRLEQAEGALQSDRYLWPMLSAMTVFRRKLMSRPKQAFIRVAAPWVIGLEDAQIDRWRAATAFAENCANFVSSGRSTEGLRALGELEPFCPFVPGGHSGDMDKLLKHPTHSEEEPVLKLGLLTLGSPDNRDVFEKAIRKEVADNLAAWQKLPEKAAPVPIIPPSSSPESASRRLLRQLSDLFSKKS